MGPAATLRCELLNGFRLLDREGHEIRISVTKGAAILAYLILSGRTAVPRGELAGLLWSEKPDSMARTALRQCLHQLRVCLGPQSPQLLRVTQQDVALDISLIATDIDDLQQGPLPIDSALAQISTGRLLYGFEDLDPAFMDWLWEMRAHIDSTVGTALTQRLETAPKGAEQLAIARVLHRLNPSLEIAARPIIEAHIDTGNVVEMLRVYKHLWDSLEKEWEEEPSQELQELVGTARVRLSQSLPQGVERLAQMPTRLKYLCAVAIRLPPATSEQTPIHDRMLSEARRLMTACADLVTPHPGCDLCAFFGLPRARESDARRGLDAALDLLEHLQNKVPDMPGRIAIAVDTGLMAMPASDKEQQTPTGEALDTAINLATITPDTGVYTTERAVRLLQTRFAVRREAAAPGGEAVLRVLGPSEGQGVPALPMRNPFVGRAPFLAALRAAWTQAAEGQLQIISLQGPAGIGKTRLVTELLAEIGVGETRCVNVQCNRADRSAPLEPLAEVARHLGEPPSDDPKTLAARLARALRSRPVVIFLDDWQWVDHASRLALQDMIDTLADIPLMLILASRELSVDDGIIRASHQIRLPPLTAREVERKAEQLLDQPIDSRLRLALYSKSGGNPLYLEEICHAIGRTTSPALAEQIPATLAANLHALISSRIETIAEAEALIVFAAAVHGERVDLNLLEEVVGQQVSDTVVDRLCGLDVFTSQAPDRALRFKHGIMRDVVYGMIEPAWRKRLHAAYFRALQYRSTSDGGANVVEQLALHARGSGDNAKAAELAEYAGDKALAASSLDLAQRQFEIAMTLLEQMPTAPELRKRWLAIALKWAQPSVYAASGEQIDVLNRAVRIATELGDRAALAAVYYWMGYISLVLGDYTVCIDGLKRSHDVACEIGDDRLIAETTAIHGCALAALSEYGASEDRLVRAIDAKNRNPVRGGRAPVTSAYARSILALVKAEQGRFDDAEYLIDEALRRVEGYHHEIESGILNTAAAVHLWRGNWRHAQEYARRSRQCSERVSAPFHIGMARCLCGYTDWRLTANPEAIAEIEAAAHWLDARGMRMFMTLPFGWLAEAHAEHGNLPAARIAAERAIARAEIGEGAGAAMAARVLARVTLTEEGEMTAVRAHLVSARHWARHRGAAHEMAKCDLEEADLMIRTGQGAGAAKLIGRALETFARLGMSWYAEQARALASADSALVRPSTRA